MGYVTDGAPPEAPLDAAIPGYAATPPTPAASIEAEAMASSPTRYIADWLARGVTGQKGTGGALARGLTVEAGEEGGMTPEQMGLTHEGEAVPSPMMSADEINDKLAPIGADGQKVKITSSPLPTAVARVIARQKAEEIERDGVIARFQNAHAWPVNMATSAAAFLMDPLNAAALLIPGFGEEAVATALGGGALARIAGRAAVGAEVGAAAQAPLTAVRYATSDEASEYTLRDALRDMTFAAASNAVFTGSVGILREGGILRPDELMRTAAEGGLVKPRAIPPAQTADLNAVTTADAQTRYDAMKTAVAQVADGREVDVTPIYAGIPSAASSSAESGLPKATSSGVTEPGAETQVPPFQSSSLPEPSSAQTMRPTPLPSIFAGPSTEPRFSDFSLGDMEKTSNKKIWQGTDDFKALHAAAEENRPAFEAQLKGFTAGVDGAEVYGTRVKKLTGKNGIEGKIGTGRPGSTISDYLGGRIIVDTPDALAQVVRKVEATGGVIDKDDFIAGHGKAGYRAVHLQVGLGDGTSAEIQVVPRPIAAVLDEGHAARQPVKRLDLSQPGARERSEAALAKSSQIFDESWAKASPAWQQTTGTELPTNVVPIRQDQGGVRDPSAVAAKQAALYRNGFDQSLSQTEYNAANEAIYGAKEKAAPLATTAEIASAADKRLSVAQNDLKAMEQSGTPIHPEDKAAVDTAAADLSKVDDLEGAAAEAASCLGSAA